jgi:hypothetical protein
MGTRVKLLDRYSVQQIKSREKMNESKFFGLYKEAEHGMK